MSASAKADRAAPAIAAEPVPRLRQSEHPLRGTSRLKINPPIGRRPVLQNCTPDELHIDPIYQRSIENSASEALIRKLTQSWNWSLCQPLTVSLRPDGLLYVVDGQHRLAAARIRGDLGDLPCVVTGYATAADEAAGFIALNKQRRPLSTVDVFKAALAAGDETASAIMETLTDAGFRLARHQNYISWKPGELYCIGALKGGYSKHGRLVLSSALCALGEAFAGQVLQYAGNLLGGLIEFYAVELRQDAFDADAFIAALSSRSQQEWIGLAVAEKNGVSTWRLASAMHTVFTRAYLAALEEALAA